MKYTKGLIMAERRMFAKSIIDSDAFLDMPLSTQALYFHLSMRADDEGFVNNPKRLIRFIGAGDDELKVLLAKKFIIGFDSGVIVIKHWKIHNYIQKDRFKESNYHDEKALLSLNENNSYTLDTECVHDVRLGKVRKELGENSKDKNIDKKENLFSQLIKQWGHYDIYENIALDFIAYRKQIKKPLKTILPIKQFIDNLIELSKLGYSFDYCIEQMKANEWQTIKIDYIHKSKKYEVTKTTSEHNEAFLKGYFEADEIIDTEVL